MEKAKFTVYGEPKGKGRPRFNTNTGHAITPKDTVSYENLVKLEWQTAYGTERFPKEAMLDMRISEPAVPDGECRLQHRDGSMERNL